MFFLLLCMTVAGSVRLRFKILARMATKLVKSLRGFALMTAKKAQFEL